MNEKLNLIYGYDMKDTVGRLFQEYTDMLVEKDQVFAKYLELQNYDDELLHLEEKYGLPMGRLYLAMVDGEGVGSIALRKIDDENCELKRLYVKPQYRKFRIGSILIKTVIDDAKKIGYKNMLLDTLPYLSEAKHLYEKYGFVETQCYNNSPMSNSIFMKLKLK